MAGASKKAVARKATIEEIELDDSEIRGAGSIGRRNPQVWHILERS